MEFLGGGEIKWRDANNNPVLRVDQSRRICRDVILGLEYRLCSYFACPAHSPRLLTFVASSPFSGYHPPRHQACKPHVDIRPSHG